jgi:hypothetical protein
VGRSARLKAVVAAAVLVVVAATSAACGSSSPKRHDPPTSAQVSALLARHTQAVRAHSAAAFLADVDGDARAAGFRARQAAQIGALATVPLASWSYSVDAQVSDPAATAAASSRYGAPAVIVRIALAYRLSGIDVAESVHDVWWTFVQRAGRTVLAGDDDLAASGGASWRGPWDFGPIVVARAPSVVVLGHADAAKALPGIAAAASAAVPAVTDVVGTQWPRAVAVFVPSKATEFAALSGGVGSTDVAAVAIFDQAGSGDGARVVVRPDIAGTLTPTGLQVVLRHEITHVATAATTTPVTPRWLIEGFADYVGNRDSGQPIPIAAAELATAVRAGNLPTALPKDTDFSTGGTGSTGSTGGAVQRVYEESWLACNLIASKVGPTGLAQLYVAVGRSTAPNDTAFGVVLQQRLGLSLAEFVMRWRAYLRAQLG